MNRFKSKIPDKKVANNDLTANKWYQSLKAENIIPTLHPIENYSSEYKKKHKPWYMLTKNELKEIWKGREIKPKTGKAYFDWIIDEKMAKWEKKHPKPEDDLFKEEFIQEWNKNREEELARIRDVVISQYDKTSKLVLIGRYKVSEDKYENKLLVEISDNNLEFEKARRVNYLTSNTSKTVKKAREITNREFKRNPNLVCTHLRNKEDTKLRVFTPTIDYPVEDWQKPNWWKKWNESKRKQERWAKYGVCA